MVVAKKRIGILTGGGDVAGLLHISKRDNGYLRMLLIHGARTALPGLAKKDTPLGRWVKALLARAHHNVVTSSLGQQACTDRLGGARTRKLSANEGSRSIEDPTTSASGRNEMASESIGALKA